MKKAQELTSIFKSVMEDGHHLIGAERATMWIYDKEKDQLWSKIATGESQVRLFCDKIPQVITKRRISYMFYFVSYLLITDCVGNKDSAICWSGGCMCYKWRGDKHTGCIC